MTTREVIDLTQIITLWLCAAGFMTAALRMALMRPLSLDADGRGPSRMWQATTFLMAWMVLVTFRDLYVLERMDVVSPAGAMIRIGKLLAVTAILYGLFSPNVTRGVWNGYTTRKRSDPDA